MRKRYKPEQDLESIQSDLIETVCSGYQNGVSVRSLAKDMGMSPMKTRKILITGGVYSTDLSTEISELYKDGKTVGEIALLLNMTTSNVNSYLPYERIIYNMDERSVEADRQQRYRDRKKGLIPPVEAPQALPELHRVRDKTMIIVVGQKLRKMLPARLLDEASDPLARERSYTGGSDIGGEFVIHEPADPDKMIWYAEITSAGRGKKKKVGIVLMSANSGFAVIAPLPQVPDICPTEEFSQRIEQQAILQEYREQLETAFMDAIRSGLLSFSLPENRVLDYTDTVARIELVKGRRSTPAIRLEELIKNELPWKPGMDPVRQFNVRGNWTNRKFGNSVFYRNVDDAVREMLGLTNEESKRWMDDFLAPVKEKMAGE